MKKIDMRNLLNRPALLIVLFILTNTVYFIMIYGTIPYVESFGNGARILDMKPFGYSPEYAKSLFSSLGKAGRDAYLHAQIPIDMAYPALFAATYSLISFYFLKKQNSKKGFYCILLAPALAGLFDYLENISIIAMLKIQPDFSILFAKTANFFTISKSVFSTLTFLILLVVLSIAFKNFIKKK